MRAVMLLLVALAGGSMAFAQNVAATDSLVSVADVHRFVAALQAMPPQDSTCAGLAPYLDAASPGLAAYRSKFGVGRAEICRALHRHPERYARLDTILPGLDSAEASIREVFARYKAIMPDARMPRVYVVVGNGISAGNTTRGRDAMILVGAELTGSARGLPHLVAHELTHTQQDYPMWRSWALGFGPSWMRATVLRLSLMEGIGDVVAEVLTGVPKRSAFGESHEQEIWAAFQKDMHGGDYDRWLYNGGAKRPEGWPPDLGYWVGYKIGKAYYDRRADKTRAIREMLTIRDFDAFLAASGYCGGCRSSE